MSWYDVFARFYDRSLEALYLDARVSAADALQARDDALILDLPCGTGQSLPHLCARVPNGRVLGVDASEGMLKQARARVEREGLSNVELMVGDATQLSGLELPARPTHVHMFLGLTAFPDWEACFEQAWESLAPGGRMVVVDVHADPLGFQGRMVNLVARADIRRRVWEPLQRVSEGFERKALPNKREYGGELFVAAGSKPG